VFKAFPAGSGDPNQVAFVCCYPSGYNTLCINVAVGGYLAAGCNVWFVVL